MKIRIGLGYDSHRFEAGRKLMLGGVEIPHEAGLKGHSDADVLIHGIIDALLGAAALGNIGSFFPDTHDQWRGADSAALLKIAVDAIGERGWRVGNIDATVICERPKLGPHLPRIRARLAALLNVCEDDVSVKGKTNEKMDDVGAGIGVAVHCAALLERE